MPKVYKQLEKVRKLLEKHYRDMQDMEFTVEEGTLYMLQTRMGKRTPTATFEIAVDMAKEGLITKEEAIDRIKEEDIERLFYPIVDPSVSKGRTGKAKNRLGHQCGAWRRGRQRLFSRPKRPKRWPQRAKKSFWSAGKQARKMWAECLWRREL